jgi:hypothetical protein
MPDHLAKENFVAGATTIAPTLDTDVSTKKYVDDKVIAGGGLDQATADTRYVNVAGDTMTGPLYVPSRIHKVDEIPFARYTAAARSISNGVWTQFTSISISDHTPVGQFGGGTNLTVPDSGYYLINMRVSTTVAGRLIGSCAADGDANYGLIPYWVFDSRGSAINDIISGSRIMYISSILAFWVFASPASSCALYADIARLGR